MPYVIRRVCRDLVQSHYKQDFKILVLQALRRSPSGGPPEAYALQLWVYGWSTCLCTYPQYTYIEHGNQCKTTQMLNPIVFDSPPFSSVTTAAFITTALLQPPPSAQSSTRVCKKASLQQICHNHRENKSQCIHKLLVYFLINDW